MAIGRLSKLAARMSAAEKKHLSEAGLGPGVPKRKTSPLPKVKEPKTWEFSAHPHHALRAGTHTDIRLGNPETGIAHSFVMPRRTDLPSPGKSVLLVPTYDHTIPYMDYTGPISTEYGKGVVKKGRRTQTEVYHADPGDEAGTKVRFNLYDGANPEEFSARKDKEGRWFLHNKTLTRERRPDLPSSKASYKEIDVDDIDPVNDKQAMMPKLDGAHGVLDLSAGRSARVFSYRVGKKSKTGLIEHTHKMPDLLKDKVPKKVDRTVLRGEILAVDRKGKAIPSEMIAGLLNSKVWESRAKQAALGVKLKMFPFDVVKYKGKSMEDAPFSKKLEVLREVDSLIDDLALPELATTPQEKIKLMNKVRGKKHPLTEEGFVLVDKDNPGVPTKAKFAPDFDVYIRDIHAASKKGGGTHDRAGAVSYSWTPDGPIAGQFGGFKHDEARDMLRNPDDYKGRVAKVKAMKMFSDKDGNPKALFQPRFKEWHLDKGDIEKNSAMEKEAPYASAAQRKAVWAKKTQAKKAANIESGLKTATINLLMKFAGDVDVEALKRLEQSIRAGDILQFAAQPSDVARGSIRKGLSHQLISTPIQKATGSPEHHTAIYVGKDPKTGKMMLAHNFEQAGKSGVTVEPVERYGRSVKLTAYRPAGVTPEQAAAAAEEAKALAASGQTAYSKRNLVGAGLQTAAGKQEGRVGQALSRAAKVVGKSCDPGTGICSHLPVDVYGKHLGREKALEMFAGKQVAPELGHVAVTPATISESRALQRVGEYSPKNLERSMRSAVTARAREKAVGLLPKLRQGLRAVTRGRL